MKPFTRFAAPIAAAALALGGSAAMASSAGAEGVVSGGSAGNPIIVASPSDVPQGAVEDKVSTYVTGNECDATRSWVMPGSDAVTHDEGRYLQVIPAVQEVSHQEWNIEGRSRTITPAVEEVSHKVFSYVKTVEDFKTVYKGKYQKFVKGNVEVKPYGSRSWEIKGTFDWEVWAGDLWGTNGSFKTNEPWTDTEPPALHADAGGHNDTSATYDDGTKRKHSTHYRYQLIDVEKKSVPSGTHEEFSGEVTEPLGEPWVLLEGYPKTVVDVVGVPEIEGPWSEWTRINKAPYLEEPTAPANTRTHEYRVTDPIKVIDVEAAPGYTLYFVVDAEPSLDPEDASWVESKPEGDWTLFDERTVTDAAAVAPQYFAWSDEVECEVVIVKKPPVKIVKVTEVTELAQTGNDWLLPAAMLGLTMIVAGGVLAYGATRRVTAE